MLLRDERGVSIGLTNDERPSRHERAHGDAPERKASNDRPTSSSASHADYSCCSSDYPRCNLGDAHPAEEQPGELHSNKEPSEEQILGTGQQVEQRAQRGTTKEENEAAHKDDMSAARAGRVRPQRLNRGVAKHRDRAQTQ